MPRAREGPALVRSGRRTSTASRRRRDRRPSAVRLRRKRPATQKPVSPTLLDRRGRLYPPRPPGRTRLLVPERRRSLRQRRRTGSRRRHDVLRLVRAGYPRQRPPRRRQRTAAPPCSQNSRPTDPAEPILARRRGATGLQVGSVPAVRTTAQPQWTGRPLPRERRASRLALGPLMRVPFAE